MSEKCVSITEVEEAIRRDLEAGSTGEDSAVALLDRFTHLVTDQLGVDRASLMLVERSTECLQIVSQRGLEHVDTEAVRVMPGAGIAGRVAVTGEPCLVPIADGEAAVEAWARPGFAGSFVSAPTALSVPLRASGTVVGVFNLTRKRSGRPFEPEEVGLLTALADHVGGLVEETGRPGSLAGLPPGRSLCFSGSSFRNREDAR